MKKSNSMKKRAKFKKNRAHLSRPALMTLLGTVAAIFVVVLSLAAADSSKGVAAATNPVPTQVTQKRYKATRPFVVDQQTGQLRMPTKKEIDEVAFVVDQQTGQLRMPTKKEIDEVVENLATLAKRPSEGLAQTAVASGGIAIDLDGGFGGVILARPNADGTWETKCVFTFEEGAEFLGIAEDNSPQ